MCSAEDHLYYMAPMQNAPLIALFGIFSYNRIHSVSELQVQSIAHPFVNDRRHWRQFEGRSLHDYVPLYWATHTPMQYVVTFKDPCLPQTQLVFFVFRASRVLQLPSVFTTDGNASSDATQFYSGDGALEHLDWEVIHTPDCWTKEYKRKKCAEVLVPDRIETNLILQICVSTEAAIVQLEDRIRAIAQQAGINQRVAPIAVDSSLFYD